MKEKILGVVRERKDTLPVWGAGNLNYSKFLIRNHGSHKEVAQYYSID